MEQLNWDNLEAVAKAVNEQLISHAVIRNDSITYNLGIITEVMEQMVYDICTYEEYKDIIIEGLISKGASCFAYNDISKELTMFF